ncbi:Hypothetical_protein [Hexamita inflata]|uniref:Hypothetical_protein n=1 Tax=Hexamita inflata TaxID=28002 RepID=A0AA86UWW9_9EUKA|nr:Hypothetical protein HINF_LOCUS55607 [Hexamita inflata]
MSSMIKYYLKLCKFQLAFVAFQSLLNNLDRSNSRYTLLIIFYEITLRITITVLDAKQCYISNLSKTQMKYLVYVHSLQYTRMNSKQLHSGVLLKFLKLVDFGSCLGLVIAICSILMLYSPLDLVLYFVACNINSGSVFLIQLADTVVNINKLSRLSIVLRIPLLVFQSTQLRIKDNFKILAANLQMSVVEYYLLSSSDSCRTCTVLSQLCFLTDCYF